MSDLHTAKEIFQSPTEYGYNDLILHPGYVNDLPADQIDLTGYLTSKIKLKTPFVSSPMDTVTEHQMAIAMAQQGGIGFIHCNNSIEEQAQEVSKVKRYQNGFVTNPVVLDPKMTIGELKEKEYSFSSFPITEDGKLGSRFLGMVSKNEYDWPVISNNKTMEEIMVPAEKVVYGPDGCDLKKAQTILRQNKVKFLPIIDKKGSLRSLICKKDLMSSQEYPLATIDNNNQLMVGASITTRNPLTRTRALVNAGVDVIVIDSSQGASKYQVDTIKLLKEKFPDLPIIGGNVVTSRQARVLIEAGVDGIRVGCGIGSICTTQNQIGVGRPQASAVYHVANFVYQYCQDRPKMSKIPVIADGSIATGAHIVRALAIGADTVMMGSLLAGANESPGDVFMENGVALKNYRGMGSLAAMRAGRTTERYLMNEKKNGVQIAQGVSGTVTSKGSLNRLVPQLVQATQLGFQALGVTSMLELHDCLRREKFDPKCLSFAIQSPSAQRDGGVHDLFSYQN